MLLTTYYRTRFLFPSEVHNSILRDVIRENIRAAMFEIRVAELPLPNESTYKYALSVRLNALSYTLLLSRMHIPILYAEILAHHCIMQQSAGRSSRGISNYSVPIAAGDCKDEKYYFFQLQVLLFTFSKRR